MNKQGLLEEPEYANISKYLEFGPRTAYSEEIMEVANGILGNNDQEIVKNILVAMFKYCKGPGPNADSRKFKRTATEILNFKELTGCCDCSTLFTTLARCKGIPSMQIITFKKDWGKRVIDLVYDEFDRKSERIDELGVEGHYFTACFLKDNNGIGKWFYIDTGKVERDPKNVKVIPFNSQTREFQRIKRSKDNNVIKTDYYAFAFAQDYSNVGIGNIKIDDVNNMEKIQRKALFSAALSEWYYEPEVERE